MTIRSKILTSLGLFIAAIVLFGIVGLFFIDQARARFVEFDHDTVEKLSVFSAFKDSFHMSIISAYDYAQTQDSNARMRSEMMRQEAFQSLERFEALSEHSAEEKVLAQKLEDNHNQSVDRVSHLLTVSDNGDDRELLLEDIVAVRESQAKVMRTAHTEIDKLLENRRDELFQDTSEQFSFMLKSMLTIIISLVIVGMLFAIVFAQHVVRPIYRIREAAREITKGNLDVHLQENRKDELGHLMHSVNTMRDGLKSILVEKDNFITLTSHQLRTPMTIIRGKIEQLEQKIGDKLTADEHQILTDLSLGADRLKVLINETLAMSRLDEDAMHLSLQEFNVGAVLSQTIHDLQDLADSKKVQLILHNDIAKEVQILGWELYFGEVLNNLVSNAIQYSEKAETPCVEVVASVTGGTVRIDVRDNGIGIPEKQQPKVFSRFFRASNARTYRPDGTGLGLALAKKIIENMKGTIQFESREGLGSTFTISVPVSKKHG